MNPLKKRRARKRLQERAKELERIRDTAIKKRDGALWDIAENLERTRGAMRLALGSETGVLRSAQAAIWELRQDLNWPQVLKRCEVALSFAHNGTSATMAEDAVKHLQRLADSAADCCARQRDVLAAVQSARTCADGLADALSDLAAEDIDRMIMSAPALAEAVFRQKGQAVSDAALAETILGVALDERRRQIEVVSRLPHRRRIGHRAQSLVDLAVSGDAGCGVADLHFRHESVGAAATAIHKDQFGRLVRTIRRSARRPVDD